MHNVKYARLAKSESAALKTKFNTAQDHLHALFLSLGKARNKRGPKLIDLTTKHNRQDNFWKLTFR